MREIEHAAASTIRRRLAALSSLYKHPGPPWPCRAQSGRRGRAAGIRVEQQFVRVEAVAGDVGIRDETRRRPVRPARTVRPVGAPSAVAIEHRSLNACGLQGGDRNRNRPYAAGVLGQNVFRALRRTVIDGVEVKLDAGGPRGIDAKSNVALRGIVFRAQILRVDCGVCEGNRAARLANATSNAAIVFVYICPTLSRHTNRELQLVSFTPLRPDLATVQSQGNVRISSLTILIRIRPDPMRVAEEYAIDAIDVLSRGRLLEGSPRQTSTGTGARGITTAKALRAAARDYGKTTARWALMLDGRQQHYECQQPDHRPQGPRAARR
jgi:hypothetical protein